MNEVNKKVLPSDNLPLSKSFNRIFSCQRIQQSKNSNSKKAIVKTSKEYGSDSTAHGISYVVDETRSKGERIFWAFVVCLAISFTLYQLGTLHMQWQDHPVVTELDTVALPIEEIEFPAVTICPQGSIKNMSEIVLGQQFMEFVKDKRKKEQSRRKRAADHWNSTEIKRELTYQDMINYMKEFMREVYPGARDKPTKLTRLMWSRDPKKSLEIAVILNQTDEVECDESHNQNVLQNMNKNLNGDVCPETFQMVEGNDCIHTSKEEMTYDEADHYCNAQNWATLVGFESYDALNSFQQYLIGGT